MRRRASAVALGVASLLLTAACGSGPTPPTHHQPLASATERILGRWDVVTVSSTRDGSSSPVSAHAYVEFDRNGTVGGFDAVNHFEGTFGFTVNGRKLDLIDVRSTLIGLGPSAPKAILETQAAFAMMTSGTPIAFRIDHQRLTLYCGDLVLSAIQR